MSGSRVVTVRAAVALGAAIALFALLFAEATEKEPLSVPSLGDLERVDDRRADTQLNASTATALTQQFPSLAATILHAEAPLVPVGDAAGSGGFAVALTPETAHRRTLPALLPARGEQPVRFFAHTPQEISVQPAATRGPGQVMGTAVTYDADYGVSFWVASEGGVEEWLRVDHPTDGVLTSYRITGATAEQRGPSVVLRDAQERALVKVDAPAAWTTDGRSVAVRLEAREDTIDLAIALPPNTRGPVMVDPVWQQVDDLGYGRRIHTATRMLDGRVLITGGIGESDEITDSVEIFDPRTDSWSAAAPLPVPLRSHGEALLGDGRVLVFHGTSSAAFGPTQAFIYDPGSDSWSVADPTRALVGGPSVAIPNRAVELPTGQVLFSGQFCCSGKEAWVYDPPSDTFFPIENMKVHRLAHTLTVLPDGTILAAGGGTLNATGLNSNTAELYLPDFESPQPYLNGTWEQLPNMSSGHMDHGAELLTIGPNAGKVLVCSGLDGATNPGSTFFTPVCELYDPATKSFSLAAQLGQGRQRSGTNNGGEFMALIQAGKQQGNVVFAGGWPATWRTDVYDAQADVWTEGCWLNTARLRHTTTALPDGTVLLTGGQLLAIAPYTASVRSSERLNFNADDDDCDGLANAFDICEDNPIERDYNPVGGWCGPATGRVYFDLDENCLDDDEPGAVGVMVRADLSGQPTRYALTNADGVYQFDLPAGAWNISMVDRDYLSPVAVCGGIEKSFAIDPTSGPDGLDFGLKPQCEGTITVGGASGNEELCNGLPYGSPCPGLSWTTSVTVNNQGQPWTQGSTVTVSLPPGMPYVGSICPCCPSNTATTVQAGPGGTTIVTFDLGSGNLGGPCVIAIAQQVSQIPPGGWATSAVLNANCGQDTFTASSGSFESSACSCDPNDKAVWPPGCDAAGTIETAQALDYTVRFQNLGLGPAHTVFVTDAIDPDLDIESLVLTYSDQDITSLQIDEDRRLIVRYDDIELPAAIDDLAGSMGRFHYRIEPAVTEVGSVYTNEANIYFDQNEVVITNQVSTTIGECPDIPPGLWSLGPSKSGITNGTNPGKGKGTSRNPSGGIQPNPNNAP